VQALRKSGKLEERYAQLVAEAKKHPEDPRLNLLLYHLEQARKHPAAAKAHADAIAKFDQRK